LLFFLSPRASCLRTGQVSVFRFLQGRDATNGPDLYAGDCTRPLGLVSASAMNLAPRSGEWPARDRPDVD